MALQPAVKAIVCFYAMNLHTNVIPSQSGQHSMECSSEVYHKLGETAGLNFTWHEFNGQHAFMRDEDERFDPQLAMMGYQLALQMFGQTLS